MTNIVFLIKLFDIVYFIHDSYRDRRIQEGRITDPTNHSTNFTRLIIVISARIDINRFNSLFSITGHYSTTFSTAAVKSVVPVLVIAATLK